jgi:cell division transport system permease protein
MPALRYFFSEALASLWRGRRAGAISIATIATALFVLGGFLLVTSNLDRLVARWTAAAEFSVYFRDAATPQERDAVDRVLASSGVVAARESVTKDAAIERFRRDFPNLATTTSNLDPNPFPASVEVRLRPAADSDEVARLAAQIGQLPGVADVRYDRQWISRVMTTVTLVRGIGVLLAVVLIVAACLTVANVVRLALFARLDEVRIMALVGAPLGYLRGPFVVEGLLQGGLGALVAIGLLYAGFLAAAWRYGDALASLIGSESVTFLSASLTGLLIAGGMAVGCLGGIIAARSARSVALEG